MTELNPEPEQLPEPEPTAPTDPDTGGGGSPAPEPAPEPEPDTAPVETEPSRWAVYDTALLRYVTTPTDSEQAAVTAAANLNRLRKGRYEVRAV